MTDMECGRFRLEWDDKDDSLVTFRILPWGREAHILKETLTKTEMGVLRVLVNSYFKEMDGEPDV